jgi:hypothetical protein
MARRHGTRLLAAIAPALLAPEPARPSRH